MGVQEKDPLAQLSLPPGFRFYPTDEELLVQYLCRKVAGQPFSSQIIGEIDLYKFDPWILPSKAMFGEKEWYFFSPRDRKYPNGSRPNRVAGSGYWKATGTDKIITNEGRKVGIKKALVFYVGKAPKGSKTNWIMHEYRLNESSRKNGSLKLDDWVLCRIYKKNSSSQKPIPSLPTNETSNVSSSSSSSHIDEVLDTLPDIDHRFFTLPRINSTAQRDEKFILHNLGSENFDWATLAGLNSRTEPRQNVEPMANYGQSDVYVPSSLQQMSAEEEVQSRLQAQGIINIATSTQAYPMSLEPYGFERQRQMSGFGFK